MQDYYVVYDMSQYEKRKYLQVGLAPKADENLGVAKQYDSKSDHYSPASED